jgi:uncharacterized protein involved in exopolysaccharide biosynthesis
MAASKEGLLRELGVIARHRRLIGINVAAVTLAAVLYSLLTPEIFEAYTSLVPAEDTATPFAGMAQLLQELPLQGANFPGVTTSADVLAGIARSRRVQEPVIKEFDLARVYRAKTMEHALGTFADRLSIAVTDEGFLVLRFRDRDPARAAGALNRLVGELDQYNQIVRVSRARMQREFVEDRLKSTQRDLAVAEDSLRRYQEVRAVTLSPDERASAEAAGALIAQKLALQVELGALGQFVRPSSAPYQQRLVQLRALEAEISNLPEIGVEAVRLFRDMKIQEELYLFLSAQLEQARIDEQRALPVVQVLDPATPPEIRAWPKRKLIVISAFVLGAAVSILMAHFVEYLRRERDALRSLAADGSP